MRQRFVYPLVGLAGGGGGSVVRGSVNWMAKGDNNTLIMLAVAGGVGYYAYTQGWLTFLFGSGSPVSASTAAAALAAGSLATPVVARSSASSLAQAAAAQAAADAAAQSQANLIASMSRRRVGVSDGIPIPPGDVAVRNPGRVSTIATGVSGYRRRGMYGR